MKSLRALGPTTAASLLVLCCTTAVRGQADDPPAPNLGKIVFPEGNKESTLALQRWLTARAIPSKLNPGGESLNVKRGGILFNVHPHITKDDLDRIRLTVIYFAKDDQKGSADLEKFAAKVNKAQNFLKVYADTNGDLSIDANLTFINELTSVHFDSGMDFTTSVIQRFILGDAAYKEVLR